MYFYTKCFVIEALFFMLLIACGSNLKTSTDSTHYISKNKIYKRDSFYIATTVWQFIDKKIDIFDYYKQYKIPFSKIRVDVDSIIYSPDSLKLFSFVIISLPDYENKNANQLEYNGEDMIGFRSSKKEPWSIWYFGQYRPSGYDNYNKVRNLFRWYYLGNGKFKNDYRQYWDGIHYYNDTFPLQKTTTSIKFGYNIDDKRFWDSSIVWKKGNRIPGYYGFQTKGEVVPGYMDSPIKILPHLNYSDSLLKLYE